MTIQSHSKRNSDRYNTSITQSHFSRSMAHDVINQVQLWVGNGFNKSRSEGRSSLKSPEQEMASTNPVGARDQNKQLLFLTKG
ncbi:hypothetical protein Tco_0987562 [Tanacetum coccineum]